MSLITDNDDELIKQIKLLNQNLARKSGGNNVTVNKTVNVHEPDEENTATYFSTGQSPIPVENSFERIKFGLIASMVNIRADNDIFVAFENPSSKQSAVIYLTAEETPFSQGSGDLPLDTAFCWVQCAVEGETANVQIIAQE